MDEESVAVKDGYEEEMAEWYFDVINARIHRGRGASEDVVASERTRYLDEVAKAPHVQQLLVEMQPKRRVWEVLVQECGARLDMFDEFNAHWPDCGEFRFQGALGFGGKIFDPSNRGDVARVTCYSENETDERLAMMARADARLAALA